MKKKLNCFTKRSKNVVRCNNSFTQILKELLNCNRINAAEVKKCSEIGCSLKKYKRFKGIILKGEKLNIKSRVCDCIIFDKNMKAIFFVELKRKYIKIDECKEKFKKTFNFFNSKINLCNNKVMFVILCKGKKVGGLKINICNKDYRIIEENCGISLEKIGRFLS